ncbi:unnamed protein product [Oikopleura dioica]|uniref:Uncharacterized protein n=1 Tax=Oikopleura dioica TaxID=34765 RepID=E4XGI6_OIKDI|nr:unnamed protein product [Oikopleura dioica]
MGQSVQHATSASVKKASSKLKNLGQGLGKGITKMKKDTSEASSNFKAKIQSQKAGSTKSKNPTSPTKGEPLLDISDVDSDIDDLDTQQFLEDPAIKKYKNSFKPLDTSETIPRTCRFSYISNRLADYAQEQLALLEAPNYTVYFVTGMAKGENMPSLKTSERLRLRWSSKKTLKKLFFIHLGVKNNIYISRLMSSLSEETKSKLIKCTKTKSLEKYGHNSKLPLPIDLANYDKNV